MSESESVRHCAHLVVIDCEKRLLLFRDNALKERLLWRLAGSELPGAEGFPMAATRALERETGLTCPLGPLLREYDAAMGQLGEQRLDRYFLVRCPHRGENPIARAAPYHWWTPQEMKQAAAEQFSPAWLPELFANVLFSQWMMPFSASRFQTANNYQYACGG